MRQHFPLITFGLVILILAVGCQGTPVIPEAAPDSGTQTQASVPGQPHHCFGYYGLIVDTESFEIEVIPMRSSEWHFNVTGILNSTMGVSAVGVPSEHDPANGLFVFDITLTHPFASKPQFTGFDVKGILMAPGTLEMLYGGSLLFSNVGETRLENADGLTRWWNPTEFITPGMFGYVKGNLTGTQASLLTATVNPYKLYADVLDAESDLSLVTDEPMDSPNGRAVFSAGASNTRRFRIRFKMDPGPQVKFGYAVDAAWALPSPNPPISVPGDFPITANQPEAYRIEITPTENLLFYDTETGTGGGWLKLQVDVYDWQGQDAGYVQSEVSWVVAYAPELFSGVVEAGDFISNTATYTRYSIDLNDQIAPSHAGQALVICQVGSKDGSTYKQTAAPAPNEALSAYQAIVVDITDPECVGDANNDFIEAVNINFGVPIFDQVCLPDDYRDFYTFTVPDFYYPTGTIELSIGTEPSLLGLYDASQTLVTEQAVSGGKAVIELDTIAQAPGKYYIRVYMSNASQIGPYKLLMNGMINEITKPDAVDVTKTLTMKAETVLTYGDYVLLLGRKTFWVYDFTNPAAPVLISSLAVEGTDEAVLNYPYLYYYDDTSGGAGDLMSVNMIDLTDPANPVQHEDAVIFGFYPWSMELAINSSKLYVCLEDSGGGVGGYIYDWSTNPESPELLNSAPFLIEPNQIDCALVDPEGPDTRLILNSAFKVTSYNVENPIAVTASGSYDYPENSGRALAINGEYIFASHTKVFGYTGTLFVLEQKTSTLELKTSLDIAPVPAEQIVITNTHAYISGQEFGIVVCDISDPLSPLYKTTIATYDIAGKLAIGSGYLYSVLPNAGLEWFDISDPDLPVSADHLKVINGAIDMAIGGNYLYVTDSIYSNHSIFTLDITNPADAFIAAEYPLTAVHTNLCWDNNILVAASMDGYTMFDTSAAPNLNEITSEAIVTDYPPIPAIRGDALYLAHEISNSWIEVYDINPCCTYVKTISVGSPVTGFSFSGNIMYGSMQNSLLVFSISDPLNPILLDTKPLAAVSPENAVIGVSLFAVEDDSMEVMDISTPSSPTFLTTIGITGGTYLSQIVVDGAYAFLENSSGAPHVVSIIWPSNPLNLGALYDVPPFGAQEMLLQDGFLYELTNDGGLRIHDMN